MFEYRARIDRVVDGDTIDVELDLGFRMRTTQRLRLVLVDTPELNSPNPRERKLAMQAKVFVQDWVRDSPGSGAWPFVVRTGKDKGGFGRWLGDVFPMGKQDCETCSLSRTLLDCGYPLYRPSR